MSQSSRGPTTCATSSWAWAATAKALTGPPSVADKLLLGWNQSRVGVISDRTSTMGVDQRRRTQWRMIGGFRTTPAVNSMLKTYRRNHDRDCILEFRKIVGDLYQGGRNRPRRIRTLNHHIIRKDPRREDWIRRPDIVRIHLRSCHLPPTLPSLNGPEPTLI